jgi:hypothetical protein
MPKEYAESQTDENLRLELFQSFANMGGYQYFSTEKDVKTTIQNIEAIFQYIKNGLQEQHSEPS